MQRDRISVNWENLVFGCMDRCLTTRNLKLVFCTIVGIKVWWKSIQFSRSSSTFFSCLLENLPYLRNSTRRVSSDFFWIFGIFFRVWLAKNLRELQVVFFAEFCRPWGAEVGHVCRIWAHGPFFRAIGSWKKAVFVFSVRFSMGDHVFGKCSLQMHSLSIVLKFHTKKGALKSTILHRSQIRCQILPSGAKNGCMWGLHRHFGDVTALTSKLYRAT